MTDVDREKVRRSWHGGAHRPEYKIWCAMKRRCYAPKEPQYRNYGGRGIKVCSDWKADFAAFWRDMGPRPSKAHSIERKNNDGDYEPGNCIWATADQQMRNRRNTMLIRVNDIEMAAYEWSRLTGIQTRTIIYRIRAGWSPERAVSAPPDAISNRPTTILNRSEAETIRAQARAGARHADLAAQFGVSCSTVNMIAGGHIWR